MVVVLQELKGRGQGPVCRALMLRCAVLAQISKATPTTFWNIQTPLPHPCSPTPSGWNNFLLDKEKSIWLCSSSMCRHFKSVLAGYWPYIMHRCVPEMSQHNCLIIEWCFQNSWCKDKYWMLGLVSCFLSFSVLANNQGKAVHTLKGPVSLIVFDD